MNRTLALSALGLAGLWAYRRWGRPRYDFRGKVALVTGSSRGLGLLLARELVRRGARVAICARDADELADAFDDLVSRGGEVVAVECDVTDRAGVHHLVSTAQSRLGPIDVLVNNAGIISVGPMETMRLEDYREAMAVHFWSSVYTTLEVLPEMRARRAGRIVNISSIGGKIPVPHLVPYTASKFAVTGLSAALRTELANDGITVTTICPGLMRTGSHLHARFKGQHEKEYAWFALGASVPGMSMSGESAARQILDACARGDAELVTTLPAKAAVVAYSLFPELFSGVAELVDRWVLPEAGGIGPSSRPGHQSRGKLPEFVTTLPDRASRENNELFADRGPSRPAQPVG
jgi:NAD(P)-dependent dehydrogenase (short-subunit alcohol dehydrogenase family)